MLDCVQQVFEANLHDMKALSSEDFSACDAQSEAHCTQCISVPTGTECADARLLARLLDNAIIL
jgi:hypothetical protein